MDMVRGNAAIDKPAADVRQVDQVEPGQTIGHRIQADGHALAFVEASTKPAEGESGLIATYKETRRYGIVKSVLSPCLCRHV